MVRKFLKVSVLPTWEKGWSSIGISAFFEGKAVFSNMLFIFLRMKYSSFTFLVLKKKTRTAAMRSILTRKVEKYVSGSKLMLTRVDRFSLSSWYF